MSTQGQSTGQIVGGIVGAVVGFFTPIGPVASAGIPMQVGNLIEPAAEAKERKNDHP